MIVENATPTLGGSAKESFHLEKDPTNIEEVENVDLELTTSASEKVDDIDANAPPQLSDAELTRLYRKIDFRLLPMIIAMQVCSYLDRGNIGNAKLQGLTTQLNLTGNKYNNAIALYFVPYIIFEFPASLVLKKLRPSRWLPTLVMLWGLAMSLMGLIKTYPQLIGLRITMGGLEAGLFPCAAWYLSMWYPKHKLYYRMALYWGGSTIAGAFSGILAFGISFMSGTDGKLGWSWIFIIEGVITIVVGFIALFVLVDSPETATFISVKEQEYISWKQKYEISSVGEDQTFKWSHIRAALSDWQIYSNGILFTSVIAPLYGISFFLPTIINNFGFSPAASQLLSVPPYVFGTVVGVIFAEISDRKKLRSPFVLLGQMMCLLGFGIQISNAPVGVKYFGTFFCVAGSYGMFPSLPSWISNNTMGQYKRGMAIMMNTSFGNTSGAIVTSLFRGQDAPRYILGNALELGFTSFGVFVLAFQVLMYRRINSKRDKIMKEREERGEVYTVEELRRMGDKSPTFRYNL